MSIRTELDKSALYLRNARNAVIGRGGEISATAGFKDLSEAITNIPNDQTLAWQTVESNSKRVTVPSGVLPMAQIKKIGGMSYKDEESGTLRDSKTTSIVSEGRNLCNLASASMSNGTIVSRTKNSVVVKGNASTTPNQAAYSLGWFYPSGTEKSEYAFDVEKGKPIKMAYQVKLVEYGGYFDNVQILLRIKPADGSAEVYTYGSRVTIDENIQSLVFNVTPTATGKCAVLLAINGNTVEFSNILITKGDNTDYASYIGTLGITNIPEAVRNLEGYGLGINADYYNYVVWRDGRCYFGQSCKKLVFDGTERWFTGGTSSNGIYRVYYPLPLGAAFVSNATATPCICNHYDSTSPEQTYKLIEGASLNATNMYIYDSRYNTNDISLWKAYLAELYAQGNPLTIIYALAEPIETDITDLMTVDNHIAVEGGGTVEFNNEYGYDIPNEINYLFNTAGG